MDSESRCLYCKRVLVAEWGRSDRKYCDESCRSSYWYRKKYKTYYDAKYQKLKREWERSLTGKKAGVPIRQWLKMDPEFRE